MLPVGYTTSLVKVLFCVNLICSYSIIIHPTNAIIEGALFANVRSKGARKWSKNISRAIVCGGAALVALSLGENLENFLGLMGALLCSPLALTIPAALHLKVLAETPLVKLLDILLLAISFGLFVFCTQKSIENWE